MDTLNWTTPGNKKSLLIVFHADFYLFIFLSLLLSTLCATWRFRYKSMIYTCLNLCVNGTLAVSHKKRHHHHSDFFVCAQVSTGTGIISYFVNLFIAVPEAFILGNGEYHVEQGSNINLVCVIEKVSVMRQWNILWLSFWKIKRLLQKSLGKKQNEANNQSLWSHKFHTLMHRWFLAFPAFSHSRKE